MFFIINVDLTEEGLCKDLECFCVCFGVGQYVFDGLKYIFPVSPVHVEDIIFHMFQYIQKLRTEGPQEWVFQECKV